MRREAIEVMAKAMYRFVSDNNLFSWDDEDAPVKEFYLSRAAAALDAALTHLEANAEVWERQVAAFSAGVQVYGLTAIRLLAVLRKDD